MTVGTHLSALASDLIPDAVERASIARSIGTLRTRLSSYFETDLKEQLQFGSSTRGTLLTRAADEQSDVDYMVVFDNAADLRPQSFIERLRRFAEHRYASSEIRQSHPTVQLELNHIVFELVPAFRSWLYGYQIPARASTSEWISTDPNDFNNVLERKNKQEGSQMKPLIRLMKYWNARAGYPFESYGLERDLVRQSYWLCSTLKEYLYDAVDSLSAPLFAPKWKVDAIDRAKRIVDSTRRLERDGYPDHAEREIQKLFPSLD